MISKRWIARLFVLALVIAVSGVALATKGVDPSIPGPRLNDMQYDFANPYGEGIQAIDFRLIPLRVPTEPGGSGEALANATTENAGAASVADASSHVIDATQAPSMNAGGPMFVGGGGAGAPVDRRASAKALRGELRDVNDALGL